MYANMIIAQPFTFVVAILINAVVLGLETDRELMATAGPLLRGIDLSCLVLFVVEILGAVQGRVRDDGTIDVRLEATRWVDTVLNGDPRAGGVGGGGVGCP